MVARVLVVRGAEPAAARHRLGDDSGSQVAVQEPDDQRVQDWLAELEARHFADLTFPEVSRALRALSSAYVERRATLGSGAALSGAGKRAAFALFYAPLHFLLIRLITGALPRATSVAG